MKIIIAGTRNFTDKHLLFCQMDYIIAKIRRMLK
jgi:hypothetical protein